eukprot:TRINITY_DN11645_c0_g1_i2.p1 TRINITY_DN11645_c0_g1~~TRINITY_DN11645_c0_g1_i2.p1  ORF type:complete len:4230 (+),score=966.32 TRINITY_DN11645_c0_g1_i2:1519-12690(+)
MSGSITPFDATTTFSDSTEVLELVAGTGAADFVVDCKFLEKYPKLAVKYASKEFQEVLGLKVVRCAGDVFSLLPWVLGGCKVGNVKDIVKDKGVVDRCHVFWKAVGVFDKTLPVPEGWAGSGDHWCIIPCSEYCCTLDAGSVLLSSPNLPSSILPTLASAGIHMTSVFIPSYVKPSTPPGILQALHSKRASIPQSVAPSILSWLRTAHAHIPDDLPLTRDLPIWPLYSAPEEYITSPPKLVPANMIGTPLEGILKGPYVIVDKTLHRVLEGAGVPVEKSEVVWKNEFLGKAQEVSCVGAERFVPVVVQAVAAAESDVEVREVVKTVAIFPCQRETEEEEVVYKPIGVLFDPAAYKVAPFLLPSRMLDVQLIEEHSNGRLLQLGALGLRSTLDKAAVLELATDLQDAKTPDFDKAAKLLKYINDNIDDFSDRYKTGFLGAFKRLTTSTDAETKFFATLGAISWFPSLRSHPEASFTPPSTLLPASGVRPLPDFNLCYHHKGVLPVPVDNLMVHDIFGWKKAGIPAATLVAQLVTISKSSQGGDLRSVGRTADEIYSALYEHHKSGTLGPALAKLEGEEFIWVEGHGFVGANCVAEKTPVHGLPGLYQLDGRYRKYLPLLRECGVGVEFSAASYAQGLVRLHDIKNGKKLAPEELTLVTSVLIHVRDIGKSTIYVPDAAGVLRPPAELLYNDVWWEELVLSDLQHLVHQNISREVAHKLGVISRRDASCKGEIAEYGESYGQSESITDRIKNILKDYVDDVGILNEVVQNADDSGATEFVVVLDKTSYSKEKLLDPAMAAWQGPAVLMYNDKPFTESDFTNLSEIGKGNKVQDVAKTGKFGLGFNAVYQFTDVPSFVSGGDLVLLDPHRKYLTQYTKANAPGFRVKVPSGAVTIFSDQFTPYKQKTPYFNCSLDARFEGTLFRFPLRTEETAAKSAIKKQAYSLQQAEELLASFCEGAEELLLFLKHVRSVKVMVKEADGTVRKLFDMTKDVDERGARDAAEVYKFVAGCWGKDTKEDFKKRLQETDDSALPSSLSRCTVRREMASGEKIVDEWVVSTVIGGGAAKRMAVAANDTQRLVPWAGAALLRSRDSKFIPIQGKAFCVLPLPSAAGSLDTAFHINGLFELSSNRRNLWMDDFKTGGEKSSWNTALIEGACVPAAIKLIRHLQTDKKLRIEDYYSLLPPQLDGIWSVFTTAFYTESASLPMLNCNGKWIAKNDAIFKDDATPAPVVGLLRSLGCNIVDVDARLRSAMNADKIVDHDLVRSILKSKPMEAASPAPDEATLAAALQYCLKDLGSHTKPYDALQGLPLVKLMDGKFVKFGPPGEEPLYFTDVRELVTTGVKGKFLCPDYVLRTGLRRAVVQATPPTNVVPFNHESFGSLYPLMFPELEGMTIVGKDNPAAPPQAWLRAFWKDFYKAANFVWGEDVSRYPLIPTTKKVVAYCERERVLRSTGVCDKCFTEFGVELLAADGEGVGVPPSILPKLSFMTVAKALYLTHGEGLPQKTKDVGDHARAALLHYMEADYMNTAAKPRAEEIRGVVGEKAFALLPIFPSAVEGETVSVDGKHLLAPDTAHHVLFTKRFYGMKDLDPSARANRTSLLRSLGVDTVNGTEFLLDHVIPALSDPSTPEPYRSFVDRYLVESILKGDFTAISKELSESPWVKTQDGSYKRPTDVVDPTIKGVTIPTVLLPDTMYHKKSILGELRKLGMQVNLTGSSVMHAARNITTVKGADDLIRYVSTRRVPEEREEILRDLVDVACVAVYDQPPVDGIPWNPNLVPENMLMAPTATRPLEDAHLCSYTYGIARDTPDSCRSVWYSNPVTPEALVKQVEMCGLQGAPYEVVKKVYIEVARRLHNPETREMLEMQIQLLKRCKVVYVGVDPETHQPVYQEPGRVSMVTMDIDARPMLYDVPSECLGDWAEGEMVPLRIALGVRKCFTYGDYAPLLGMMAEGKDGEKLTEPELRLSVEIANYVAAEGGSVTHLPDTSGVLQKVTALVYDVANTTSAGAGLVHPAISNETAKILGVRSKQEGENKHYKMTMEPSIVLSNVIKYVKSGKPTASTCIRDLLEVAHTTRSDVVFVHDTRTYSGALMIPEAEEYQDEALVVHFTKHIGEKDLLKLFKRSWGGFEGGLGGCFAMADMIEALTDDKVLLYQPLKNSLCYNLDDVKTSFPSHLEPLLHYARYPTTLRIPLRAKPSTFGDAFASSSLRTALHFMTSYVPYTLPFVCISKVIYQELTQDSSRDVMCAQAVLEADPRPHMWSWIPPRESGLSSILTTKKPEAREFVIDVHITGEDASSQEGKVDQYKWGVCLLSGAEDSRKLGMEYEYPPLGGVAALLQKTDQKVTHEFLKMTSRHMKPIGDGSDTPNLPVQIFTNYVKGNDKWNSAVQANVWGAYVTLLFELCRRDGFGRYLAGPSSCYEYWPSLSADCKYQKEVRKIYEKVKDKELYLHQGEFKKSTAKTAEKDEVKFVTAEMSAEVISTIAKEVKAVYDTPSHVGVGVVSVRAHPTQGFTPSDARSLCKEKKPSYGFVGKLSTPAQVVEVLSLAMSDLTPETAHELHGVYLLPFETSTHHSGKPVVEPFGKKVFLGNTEARKVFEGIDDTEVEFIHPDVLKNVEVCKKLSSKEFKEALNIRTPDANEVKMYLERAHAKGAEKPPAVWQGRVEIPADEAKELSAEWLSGFWRVMGVEGKEVVGWPLLPLEDGRLVDAQLAEGGFIFREDTEEGEVGTPEAVPQPPPAPVASPPSGGGFSSLYTGFTTLLQGGFNLINAAISDTQPKHLYAPDPVSFRPLAVALGLPILPASFPGKTKFQPPGTPPQVIAAKLAFLTSKNAVSWDAVEPGTKRDLLSYFAQHLDEMRPRFAAEHLKKLPIFKKLSGDGFTTLERRDTYAAPEGNPFFKPDDSWITSHEEDLLQILGVRLRTATDIWRLDLLPALETADFETRYEQLNYVRENHAEYVSDRAFFNYMVETKLFPNHAGDLFKASEFLHPSLRLVQDVFGEERVLLPHGRYSELDWLPFLEELGMENKVTAEIFLRCARKIDSEKDIVPPREQIYTGARSLVAQLTQEGLFESFRQSMGFESAVRKLHVVPARQPKTGQIALYKFSDCCLPAYKYLVPFSMPWLNDEWVPCKPEALGIKPPSLNNIVASMKCMDLENYPEGSDPEEDFRRTLEYLKQEKIRTSYEWEAVKKEIGKAGCVPVLGLLGYPDCMFSRVDSQRPPFVLEIPEAYAGLESVLYEMGAGKECDQSSAAGILQKIGGRRTGTRLDATELNSYIKLVEAAVGRGEKVGHLPDTSCVLRPASEVVFNDAPWMLDSIQVRKIVFTHERLSKIICEKMGLNALSKTVRQILLRDRGMDYSVDEELTGRLRSDAFICGLRDVYSMQDLVVDIGVVGDKLRRCSVVLVERLTTSFFHNESDVAEATDKSLYYIERTHEDKRLDKATIYIKSPLPPHISTHTILSQCVLDILSLPPAPYIADLLATHPSMMPDTLKSLRAVTAQPSETAHRGVPGKDVLPEDTFQPPSVDKQVYLQGECVAYASENGLFKYGEIRKIKVSASPEVPYTYVVDVGLGREVEKLPMDIRKFNKQMWVVGDGGEEVREQRQSTHIGVNGVLESERDSQEEMRGVLSALTERLGIKVDDDARRLMDRLEKLEREASTIREERNALRVQMQDVQDAKICAICYDADDAKNTCLVPCGHVLGERCSSKVSECPFCRAAITTRVKLNDI